MRALVVILVVATGCLGQYNPGPAPTPPAKTQPSPSGPTQSPSPSPTPTPPQTPTPPAADLALPPSPPSTDGGTTSACGQLTACCAQDQTCLDRLAGLDEGVCQVILDQLQQQGYCL